MLRFLLVDDHALVRSGLRRILSDAYASAHFAEASTGEEMLRELRETPWDLVILDVSLKGRSGLDALNDIHAIRPNTKVLMVSMHAEEELAVRALRAGALGYVTKEKAPEVLLDAVQRVLAGRRYLSEALTEQLAQDFVDGRPREPHEQLSRREFEVLNLLAAGRSVSAIADELALSVKTVSTYRSRVLDKLGLGSNAELVRYALTKGLVR